MTLVGELGAQVLLMKSSKLHPSCTSQGVWFRQVRAAQGVLFRQPKVFCFGKSGQLSQNRLL